MSDAYFAPTGLGSRATGFEDKSLISESALFRAHGRISDSCFATEAFAFERIERLDLAGGFAVIVFIALCDEGNFYRPFRINGKLFDQRRHFSESWLESIDLFA